MATLLTSFSLIQVTDCSNQLGQWYDHFGKKQTIEKKKHILSVEERYSITWLSIHSNEQLKTLSEVSEKKSTLYFFNILCLFLQHKAFAFNLCIIPWKEFTHQSSIEADPNCLMHGMAWRGNLPDICPYKLMQVLVQSDKIQFPYMPH